MMGKKKKLHNISRHASPLKTHKFLQFIVSIRGEHRVKGTQYLWASWKQSLHASLTQEQINDPLLNTSQNKGQCPRCRPKKCKTSGREQENPKAKNSRVKIPAGASGRAADWERPWKHQGTQHSWTLKETALDPFLSMSGIDWLPANVTGAALPKNNHLGTTWIQKQLQNQHTWNTPMLAYEKTKTRKP